MLVSVVVVKKSQLQFLCVHRIYTQVYSCYTAPGAVQGLTLKPCIRDSTSVCSPSALDKFLSPYCVESGRVQQCEGKEDQDK